MNREKTSRKTIICVNGACFSDSRSAGRHFLELASQRQKVTVVRRVETAREGSRQNP